MTHIRLTVVTDDEEAEDGYTVLWEVPDDLVSALLRHETTIELANTARAIQTGLYAVIRDIEDATSQETQPDGFRQAKSGIRAPEGETSGAPEDAGG